MAINTGSQIILPPILVIQNNNHIQEHKYLREKPFLFKEKNHGTNSKSIYIKSITIILKFMPKLRFNKYNNKSSSVILTTKEKLLVFFTLTHSH